MQRIFHTPEGVRDIYSQECSRKQKLQEKLHRVFHQYGFEDIPLFFDLTLHRLFPEPVPPILTLKKR